MGDADVMVMSGSYEYTGADGELYRVNWYADETGYHAEAEHLPRDGLAMISMYLMKRWQWSYRDFESNKD